MKPAWFRGLSLEKMSEGYFLDYFDALLSAAEDYEKGN